MTVGMPGGMQRSAGSAAGSQAAWAMLPAAVNG